VTSHLLMLSIGPVAEFIESSRRTRDLFFSSELVALMARAAAYRLRSEFEAELIIPTFPSGVDERSAPVSDQVLAVIPAGGDPKSAAQEAREAARDEWSKASERARKYLADKRLDIGIDEEAWKAQLDSDLVELFAAWVPLEDDYAVSRATVEALLAAREVLTDFAPNPTALSVPKSSLDGRRETVLQRERARFARERARAGIKGQEELDLPGIVKRIGTGRFPSISRIALDAWIEGANRDHSKSFRSIREAIERLAGLDLVSRVSESIYGDFPYDAELLLESRVKLLRDGKNDDLEGLGEGDRKEAQRQAEMILGQLDTIGKRPFPYVATLCADGDGIGQWTRACKTVAEHRELAEKLSRFAWKTPAIVTKNRGVSVFAGGDDVLAFLPIDRAVPCAHELQSLFLHEVGGTLSVGIAINHLLTPMAGTMVTHAREALDVRAKSRKNALAIVLEKRSGAPTSVCLPWNDCPEERVRKWISLLDAKRIPEGLSHDLYVLAREYEGIEALNNEEILRKEVRRLLGKKRPASGEIVGEDREYILGRVHNLESLQSLADEIIIAQNIQKGCFR